VLGWAIRDVILPPDWRDCAAAGQVDSIALAAGAWSEKDGTRIRRAGIAISPDGQTPCGGKPWRPPVKAIDLAQRRQAQRLGTGASP